MTPGARIGEGDQAEIFALDAARVVKLFRASYPRSAVLAEAHKTEVMWTAGYPAPRVFEVVEHEGRHGLVIERLDGPTLLERVVRDPGDTGLLDAFTSLQLRLAALACEVDALPPLEQRIEERCAAFGVPDEERERIRAQVASCPRGSVPYHGDFHPQNVLSTARGLVVIDWFAACRAHPAADVAQTCIVMAATDVPVTVPQPVRDHLHATRDEVLAGYVARYLAGSTVTSAEILAWLRPLARVRLHQLRRTTSVTFDEPKLVAIADGEWSPV